MRVRRVPSVVDAKTVKSLRVPLIIGGTLAGFAGLGYLLAALFLNRVLYGRSR